MRVSQEKALKALQDYTLSHYPESPAKFGELLLRIPELQRTCQVRISENSTKMPGIMCHVMVSGGERNANNKKGGRRSKF